MQFSKGQIIRLAIVGGVAGTALWLLLPWVFFDIRSNGTVNVRLITVQAPIEGTIIMTPPDVGTFVSRGEPLTRISDERGSRGIIVNLDTEREMLSNRIQALEEKLNDLGALRERLDRQAAQHKTETTDNLRYQLLEAEARTQYWESVRKERQLSYERLLKLKANGYVPAARLEQGESLLEQAKQEVTRAQTDSDRLRQEIKAAGEGIYLREGRNDVPYSQQRLDEIIVSTADLKVQIAETRGRLKAVERRFEDELNRQAKRETADVLAPVTGTIWRRFVFAQGEVAKGNEILKLLDCSRIFAEIPIPESAIDRVSIGETVSVRYQGGTRSFDAKILDIRGTRAVAPGIEYAAAPPLLKKDEALLTALITDPDTKSGVEKFCNVGRRVELRLPGLLFGN